MAMWHKGAYEPEEPIPEEKLVGYSYATKLRADANFAPSFAGLHLDGIRQRGTGGLAPQGSGADRFGVEDGGRTCRYWYDHLEVFAGSAARIVVDCGCEWRVLPLVEHGRGSATFRGVPSKPGVVTVAAPRVEDGLDVVVFDVAAHAPGETTVVLRAREPGWFLEESRERRRSDIKLEKQQRKKDAVRRAKQEEARRLVYGDDAPPADEVDVSGDAEIPPLWGHALEGELLQYEGTFTVELHFRCVPAPTARGKNGASGVRTTLTPMEVYSLTAVSLESDSDSDLEGGCGDGGVATSAGGGDGGAAKDGRGGRGGHGGGAPQ